MTWTDGVVAKLDVGLDTGGGGGILEYVNIERSLIAKTVDVT